MASEASKIPTTVTEGTTSSKSQNSDPASLNRRRTYALQIHTKTVKRVEEALTASNETRVREGRQRLVELFEELGRRHQAYMRLTVLTAPGKQSEEQWLAGVSDLHMSILRKVDTFLASLIPHSAQSAVKSTSSHRSNNSDLTNRSNSSSTSSKLRESLRAQREAELLVRQQMEEAKRREEEESKLAEIQRAQRVIESERAQRAAQQHLDRQTLTSQLLLQQLTEEIIVDSDRASIRSNGPLSSLVASVPARQLAAGTVDAGPSTTQSTTMAQQQATAQLKRFEQAVRPKVVTRSATRAEQGLAKMNQLLPESADLVNG